MFKSIEKSAKTKELAIAAALEELGLSRDDVSVEILDQGKTGFLGFGASPAVVKVTYEVPDEVVEEPVVEVKAEAVVEEAPAVPEKREDKLRLIENLLKNRGN